MAALLGRHGIDNGFHALELFFRHGRIHLIGHLPHPRQFAHQSRNAAHTMNLAQLLEEVLQVKLTALVHLFGELLRLLLINLGFGLFNQRQHIAHSQNPPRHTIGMERLQAIQFFACAQKLDRLTGNLPDRQGGPTPGIPISFGENHARQR